MPYAFPQKKKCPEQIRAPDACDSIKRKALDKMKMCTQTRCTQTDNRNVWEEANI